jgi:arginase family enzyme
MRYYFLGYRRSKRTRGNEGSMLGQVISGRKANTTEKSSTPRIITLGGDHTTTLAALRSTYKRWGGEVSVIHFDSHLGKLPIPDIHPFRECLC